MAIALVASAMTADNPGGNPFVLTMPSHSTDDLIVCVCVANLGTVGMSTPSGYTQLSYVTDNSNFTSIYFYKIATSASETISIADTGSLEKIAIVASFSGVDTTTPVDTAFAHNTIASSASPTHAGLTSTNIGWAIAMFGHDDGSDNGQNGANNGTPSGWTSIEEDGQGRGGGPFSNPSGGGAGVGMAYKAVAATTASGAHEWLLGNNEQSSSATVIFAEGAATSVDTPILVPAGPIR